jgi:hypothetical protein
MTAAKPICTINTSSSNHQRDASPTTTFKDSTTEKKKEEKRGHTQRATIVSKTDSCNLGKDTAEYFPKDLRTFHISNFLNCHILDS